MAARKTDVWNHILLLAAFKNGHFDPCGSAFLVGRNIAMTATHILEQPFDQRFHDVKLDQNSDFGVIAIQIVNRSREPLIWRVKSMHSCPSLSEIHNRSVDVAFLELESDVPREEVNEDFRKWFFELNVATPKIGKGDILLFLTYGHPQPLSSLLQSRTSNSRVFWQNIPGGSHETNSI